jgi:hypothetical protein
MADNGDSTLSGIWDSCQQKQQNEKAQRERTAARYRAAANDLGAAPGQKPGEWQLECPHCGVVTFISEEGRVYRRSSRGCAATAAIEQFCTSRRE